MIRTLVCALLGLGAPLQVMGHEFWIEPEEFVVQPGQKIVGNLITGEIFKGVPGVLIPDRVRRFDIQSADDIRPVEGRLGDVPALDVTAGDDSGLLRIVHVTGDSVLTWGTREDFFEFVRHKAADWVVEAHDARELPDAGFTEIFSRYARSLVAVGDGAGSDAPSGLLTEIVALANPYTDDLSEGLPVRLSYQGEPRTEAHIEVFERSGDGGISVSTVTTDADGIAVVPVAPGSVYLLDAVVIRTPEIMETSRGTPAWESLWASLTFAVPPDASSNAVDPGN